MLAHATADKGVGAIRPLALFVLLVPRAALALPDELEVHLDDINKPGSGGSSS
jgi:hypothetical protein